MPSKTFHNIFCGGNEHSLIISYKGVRPFTHGRGNRARDGEEFTIIIYSKAGSNHSAAMYGTFWYDGSIAHACYDAISLQEITGFRKDIMKEFCYYCTIAENHLVGFITMMGRVEGSLSVGYHTYCGETISHCCPVGCYIDTIGKAADNMHIRTFFCHIIDNPVNTILAVSSALSCADNRNSMPRIQISLSTNKKHHRSITTMLQPLGIIRVGDGNYAYLIIITPFYFLSCPFLKRLVVSRNMGGEEFQCLFC